MKAKKETGKRGKKAASELSEPRWSVVTFETRAAANLTYQEAVAEMEKLAARKVSGLCIVTDEAAAKVEDKSGKAKR